MDNASNTKDLLFPNASKFDGKSYWFENFATASPTEIIPLPGPFHGAQFSNFFQSEPTTSGSYPIVTQY